jgi:hypothetical protein
MKLTITLAILCLCLSKANAFTVNSVYQQITEDPSTSCEVIKKAIVILNADKKTVARIVEAAIMASPENIRIITQCAIAVAPDALTEVQDVYNKYTKVGDGKGGAKSSKSAKQFFPKAAIQLPTKNPLDILIIPPILPPVTQPPVTTPVSMEKQ